MAAKPIKMQLNNIKTYGSAICLLSPVVKTVRTGLKWLIRESGWVVPRSKCIVPQSAWKNPGSWFIDWEIWHYANEKNE